MKLTIVFEDYRIQTEYANGHVEAVDFWTNHGDHWEGNNATKSAFTAAVTESNHNMDDYWAIQYHGGIQQIEYANGYPNQVISSNTGLSIYTALVKKWSEIIEAERIEAERLESIPTWDDIRDTRNTLLFSSDRVVAWSTETGNALPQDWTDYRQALRDITDTYGAPTGNTELVVFPDEPSWPTT